jgi:hypothetical protein
VLGEIPVGNLRAKDMTAYQAARKQQGAAGGTIIARWGCSDAPAGGS